MKQNPWNERRGLTENGQENHVTDCNFDDKSAFSFFQRENHSEKDDSSDVLRGNEISDKKRMSVFPASRGFEFFRLYSTV